jgi:hypothetical protein
MFIFLKRRFLGEQYRVRDRTISSGASEVLASKADLRVWSGHKA